MNRNDLFSQLSHPYPINKKDGDSYGSNNDNEEEENPNLRWYQTDDPSKKAKPKNDEDDIEKAVLRLTRSLRCLASRGPSTRTSTCGHHIAPALIFDDPLLWRTDYRGSVYETSRR
jgi:hypothetical protein